MKTMCSRGVLLRLSFFVCFSLSLCGAANAQGAADDLEVRPQDILELTNGNRFIGKIIIERDDFIKFETAGGSTTVQKSDISRILYSNPPEAVYEKRLKLIEANSYDDQIELSDWCMEPRIELRSRAISHLESAVNLDASLSAAFERLLPLYINREFLTTDESERDRNLLAESEVLLRGIRAGVDLAGFDLRDSAVRSLIRIGDLDAAVILLEEIAQGDRSDAATISAMRRLVVLYDALGRIDDSRNTALQLREGGDGSDSEVLLREIRWAAEDHAAKVPGSGEKVETLMEDLLAFGDVPGSAYLCRGSVRLLDGDLAGAETDFRKAFSAGEVDAVAATTYALSFARKGDFQRALDLLASAAESGLAPVDWRLVEAYVLESQGDLASALRMYEEARTRPDSTWQSSVLAISARRRIEKDWDPVPSIQNLMQSDILSAAAFSECCLMLGDLYLERGENAAARRWLEYALASGLSSPELRLRLAMAQSGPGGNLERAKDLLANVTDEDPENPDSWNAYAKFLYAMKDFSGARDALQRSISLFSRDEKESQAVDMPASLSWAMRSLRKVDRLLGEEYWVDEFRRESDSALRNNWIEEESFGVNVSLVDGMAIFDGVQKFQPDRLTTIKRDLLTPRFVGIRTSIRLLKADEGTRVGLRIEDQSGGGIVFFRDPDGMLGFVLLGDSDPQMIRSDSSEFSEEYDLVPTRWEPSPVGHSMEISFSSSDSDGKGNAELWFDGRLVARDLPYRISRKRGLQAGVSGQAPLDSGYTMQVELFEVFRKRPRQSQEREF
ncbi:MAG: hypothetical protein CBC13_00850 [Planctomycetia bacterium TMED53]|nr:MAG: hypothetical protein CBC13_00850 [Planctomycetia bacterium TMED53]